MSNWNTCRGCGANVLWADRQQPNPTGAKAICVEIDLGGQMPLAILRQRNGSYLLLELPAQDVFPAKPHRCDPVEREQYQETAEEERSRRQEEWRESRRLYDLTLREAVRAAKPRECPKCGAEAGERCTNMSRGKKFGEPTKWPHIERMPESWNGQFVLPRLREEMRARPVASGQGMGEVVDPRE